MENKEFCIPSEALHQDGESISIFLDVARKDIVFFQAIFESYEGVGTVRTMDKHAGVISVLTTTSQLPEATQLLAALSAPGNGFGEENQWRFASHLHAEEKSRYVNEILSSST